MQDTTSYNLRNSNHFQNYRANTNLFLNSFFPATIRAWNDLPAEVKDAPLVAAFKSRLNKDLKKTPSYYNTGTRIGQILQARLRLGCSSLNADFYRKNIVPSPHCGYILRGLDTRGRISSICTRKDHFHPSMIAFPHTKLLLNRVYFL